MKWGAHHQHHGAFGAALFGQVSRTLDSFLVSGDYDLVGRIDVRRGNYLALCSVGTNLLELVQGHSQNGRHAAFTGRHGFLHITAAITHRADSLGKWDGSR